MAIAVGEKTFSTLLSNLLSQHGKRAERGTSSEPLKTDLQPYLESTFKRCTIIKTLLNPLTPANFLSIYATQRFEKEDIEFDHYGLVDFVRRDAKSIVVTGTGGSGKSMFMRYLWLSLFETSDGRIPLYVELRSLNGITVTDIVEYIFQTLGSGRSRIKRRDFEQKLKNGDFIFVLDGFDEISEAKQLPSQQALLSLANEYPKLKIVLSGRPDERFASWPTFSVIKVAPLRKPDVNELVTKAEFDEDPKKKFLSAIRSGGLFEKHQSFLSNPLLASMMLLTFSYNFDIPDRMHLFYAQAFDALFQRHDSHKPGGYKREFKSGLSEDNFKRLLSYFCLITYHDQKLNFGRQTAINAINKAKSIEKVQIEAADFLHDLCQCVCVLTQDGLDYTFTHRSFQEYFCAFCLAYVTTQGFSKFCEQFSSRNNDQSMFLLASMNPESFRDNYVIPFANRYRPDPPSTVRKNSLKRFIETCDLQVRLEKTLGQGTIQSIFTGLEHVGPYYYFAQLTSRLWHRSRKSPEFYNHKLAEIQGDTALFADMARLTDKPDATALLISAKDGEFRFIALEGVNPRRSRRDETMSSDELEAIFLTTWISGYLSYVLRGAGSYIKEARAASTASSSALKELFKI